MVSQVRFQWKRWPYRQSRLQYHGRRLSQQARLIVSVGIVKLHQLLLYQGQGRQVLKD